MKNISLFIILFLIANILEGQLAYKLGKYSEEELALTTYEADPEAAAVVFQHRGNLSIQDNGNSFYALLVVQRRIKILKERGIDYGNVVIPFYSGNGMEKVRKIKGCITTKDNQLINLNKTDIKEVDINEYYSEIRIAYPKVQVGAIIDLKYEILLKDLVHLRKWYFQEELPVAYTELKVELPSFFQYRSFYDGYGLGNLKALKEEDGETIPMKIDFSGKNKFVIKNVPAMVSSGFLSSMENFRCSVRFQLDQVNYPNGQVEKYLKDWTEFTNEYNTNPYRGRRYMSKTNYNDLLKAYATTQPAFNDPYSKIKDAYEFVNKNITWNHYYSTSNATPLNKVLKEGRGNSTALAQALIVLLRSQEIKAYPMLCVSREDGYPFKEEPLSDQFSNTLVYAEFDGQYLLLEPGYNSLPPGYISIRFLNHEGLVIKENEALWIPIDPSVSSSATIVRGQFVDNEFKAIVQSKKKGYDVLTIDNENKDYIKKQFQAAFPIATISNYEEKYSQKIDPELTASFEFKLTNSGNDEIIYLQPILFSPFSTNPFVHEKRYHPVEFEYRSIEKYISNIKIPSGYAVDELPENLNLNFGDKGIVIKTIYEQKNSIINIHFSLSINRLIFHPKEYKNMRAVFDRLAEKLAEPIVLKKIS